MRLKILVVSKPLPRSTHQNVIVQDAEADTRYAIQMPAALIERIGLDGGQTVRFEVEEGELE